MSVLPRIFSMTHSDPIKIAFRGQAHMGEKHYQHDSDGRHSDGRHCRRAARSGSRWVKIVKTEGWFRQVLLSATCSRLAPILGHCMPCTGGDSTTRFTWCKKCIALFPEPITELPRRTALLQQYVNLPLEHEGGHFHNGSKVGSPSAVVSAVKRAASQLQ